MDTPYDFDAELYVNAPYLKAQMFSETLRKAPRPLPSMPSSSVETPQPRPGVNPLTPATQPAAAPDYRGMALQSMQQASSLEPSETDRQALTDYARKRDEGSRRDFAAGLALSALGGESFSGIGGHVLKQSLAAREPMKFAGGMIADGAFIADPEEGMKRRQLRLENQAKIYEAMAHNAETVEQRRAAAEAANEVRREGLELRRAMAANRPARQEPLVQVFDPQTQQTIYVPRSQAAGMQAPPRATSGFAGPKMPAEIARMSIGIRALEKTLDEYEQALKEFGPRTSQQLNQTERAKMNSIASRVQLEAKEMFTLGALTGPDVDVLNAVIANPASWRGALYGKGGLNEQLASMRNSVKARRGAIDEQYGSTAGGPGGIRNPAGVMSFPGGGGRGAPPPGAVQRLD